MAVNIKNTFHPKQMQIRTNLYEHFGIFVITKNQDLYNLFN